MAKARVVILGGGVGGVLTANLLAKHSNKLQVRLVDPTGVHIYQPGWLRVPLGELSVSSTRYSLRRLLRREVELIHDSAERIDPDARVVLLRSGERVPYDYLVVGTGAHPDASQIPGLAEGGHTFYTEEGAVRLAEALRHFQGGRIVLGVGGFPYKCPPAPHEFALLLDDWLRARGLRERTELTFVTPLNRLFPIETVAPVFEQAFQERGICVEKFFNAESVDPHRRVITSLEGTELNYDLLILIAPHTGAEVVRTSGLGDRGGWLPTDKHTLQVKGQERIFGIGDATDLPVSKSGAAAHFEAEVLARNLVAEVTGNASQHPYDGHVMCMIETGGGKAMLINFSYERAPRPPRPSGWMRQAKGVFRRVYPLAVLRCPLGAGIKYTLRPGGE